MTLKIIESQLEDYPGTFSLPEPFLDMHMRAWWEASIEPLKGMSQLDYDFFEPEWNGALVLIREFGSWGIEGIPLGELESDAMPSAVKSWAMQEVSNYVTNFLPPKAKLKLYETFVN